MIPGKYEMLKGIKPSDLWRVVELLERALPLLGILSPTNTGIVANMERQLAAHTLCREIRDQLESLRVKTKT
jgi:hypothetical protein